MSSNLGSISFGFRNIDDASNIGDLRWPYCHADFQWSVVIIAMKYTTIKLRHGRKLRLMSEFGGDAIGSARFPARSHSKQSTSFASACIRIRGVDIQLMAGIEW